MVAPRYRPTLGLKNQVAQDWLQLHIASRSAIASGDQIRRRLTAAMAVFASLNKIVGVNSLPPAGFEGTDSEINFDAKATELFNVLQRLPTDDVLVVRQSRNFQLSETPALHRSVRSGRGWWVRSRLRIGQKSAPQGAGRLLPFGSLPDATLKHDADPDSSGPDHAALLPDRAVQQLKAAGQGALPANFNAGATGRIIDDVAIYRRHFGTKNDFGRPAHVSRRTNPFVEPRMCCHFAPFKMEDARRCLSKWWPPKAGGPGGGRGSVPANDCNYVNTGQLAAPPMGGH
jgi:hypothetical protein